MTGEPPAQPGAAPSAQPGAAPPPGGVPLRTYETADRKASGKVPDEPGWQYGGANGALECFHPYRGELHIGVPAMICTPGGPSSMLAAAYGWPVAPLLRPADAVAHVWPQLVKYTDPTLAPGVQVVDEHPMGWGAPFTVSMLEIRFVRAGVPWHGPILAATAPIPYDDRWLFYYSQMAVPHTDDGSVFTALAEAWRAYRPGGQGSGAQPAAAQAQTDETFKVIQGMTAARQRTFDAANAKWGGGSAPGASPTPPRQ